MKKRFLLFSAIFASVGAVKAQSPNTFPATGNVGIGTDTPGTLLDVKGSQSSNWLTTFNNTNVYGHQMYFGYTNTSGTAYGLYIEGATNANYSRYLQLGSDKFVVRGDGYVGIGTIAPAEKFHLYGGQAIIQSTSGSGGNILTLKSEADNVGEYTGLSFDVVGGLNYGAIRSILGPTGFSRLGLFTGDNAGNVLSEKFSILSNNGNVGIGTIDPTSKLEIMNSSGNTHNYLLKLNSPSAGAQSYLARNVGEGYFWDTWSHNEVQDFSLHYNPMDPNPVLAFNSTALVLRKSGNVGIGTVDPQYKLDVVGAMQVNGGASEFYGFGPSSATKPIDVRGAQYPYVFNWHTGMTFSAHSAYGGIRFYNQGYPDMYGAATMVMAITDNKVGIGTKNPLQKFVVSNEGTDGFEVYVGTPGVVGLQAYNRATPGYSDMNLDARAFAFNYGNVGIGTTNPDKALTIKSNGVIGFEYTANGSGSYHTITGGGIDPMSFAVGSFSDPLGAIFKFNGNTGTKVTILNGGNVGIGETAPTANLQIGNSTQNGLVNLGGYSHIGCLRSSGDFFAGRNVYAEYGSAAENDKIKVYQNSTSGFAAMQMTYQGDINFYAKSGAVSVNEQANLDAYNVFKIAGDGTTYARAIEITMDNFPDYVFEKEYALMTLSEVEAYIKANKHLPNVPSAKEMEENGANVADLMKIQMEKIEELTLYLIEMKKADAELKKENEEIKKQLLILQNK